MLAFVTALAASAIFAGVVFGPGAERPQRAARVWGGPFAGTGALSLRVEVTERLGDSERPLARSAIEVRARGATGALLERSHLVTDREGVADPWLETAGLLEDAVDLVVTDERGATLASGRIVSDTRGWGEPVRATEPGVRSGALDVEVRPERGVLAVPFTEWVAARVSRDHAVVAQADVELEFDGGEPARLGAGSTDPGGRVRFRVTATAHDTELRVRARLGALEGTWTGPLTVVPGALWLDPAPLQGEPPRIRVVSDVPREAAYLTIAGSSARLWGGRVALSPGARGVVEGQIAWPFGERCVPRAGNIDEAARPSGCESGVLWITVSGDSRGRGLGTVGWPVAMAPSAPSTTVGLAPSERRFIDHLLLDGMPRAQAREAERRRGVRRAALLGLGAVTLLEIAILLGQIGLGSAGMSRLAQAGFRSPSHGRVTLMFRALAAVSMLLLAFAIMALVLQWKTAR